MTKITFSPNILPDHRTEIARCIDQFRWLLPGWCQELYVTLYASDDDAGAARMGIQYEYRTAHLELFSSWLIHDPDLRLEKVLHELLHVATSIYVDFAERSINELCPIEENPKLNEFLSEQSRIYCESMTQDLARAIYDRFRPDQTIPQ